MSLTSASARRFYVDVYTGQSVVQFEFSSLDSALYVIELFVIQAQTISIYSYELNPYNYGSENIFQATSQNYLVGLIPRRYCSMRYFRLKKAKQSYSCCRTSRQYSGYQPQRISRRYRHWRSATGKD